MGSILNEHEISAICAFVPFSQLKELRTLSTTWNNGVLPIFKKRTKLRVEFKRDHKEVYNQFKLSQFSSDLKEFRNYRTVQIKAFDTPPNLAPESPYYNQMNEICLNFLQPRIKTLELIFLVRNPKEMEILEKILIRFAPELETLKKTLLIQEGDQFLNFLGSVPFPKLKRIAEPSDFKLSFLGVIDSDRLYTQFYKNAPKLEAIGEDGNYCHAIVLKPLAQDPTLLPNLNEVHIKIRISEDFSLVTNLKKQRLKMLGLKFTEHVIVDKECLFEVIEKHKGTLESLNLRIEGTTTTALSLPACPKLMMLHLVFNGKGPSVDFGDGHSINYSEHFPCLHSLSILHCATIGAAASGCSLENSFNAFFPQEKTEICKTLRRLKLKSRCIKSDKKHKKCQNRELCNNKNSRADLVREMFPNAVVEYVDSAL